MTHFNDNLVTLDILSHGRVDVGLGRTGYPYPSGLRSTQEVLHTLRLFGEHIIPHF